MAVRFDPEGRTLELAVRDLVLGDPRTRPRGQSGLRLPGRGALGSTAHQEIQRVRAGETADYQCEVAVKKELDLLGYRVTLQGRADGCSRDEEGRLVVEEIKTVIVPPPQFTPAAMRPRADHLLQLTVYCALLAEPDRPVSGLLILSNLVDGACLQFPLALEAGQALDEVKNRLGEIIRRLEEESRRIGERARLAEELCFPFPRLRPHQDELVAALARAWEQGRDLLASAPAGTGKTAAALFAGLRHAFLHRQQLFFLTAKTTQQKLAGETLLALARASRCPVRALVLRAKDAMCPADARICAETVCPYLEEYPRRMAENGLIEKLLGEALIRPARIRELAEEQRVCPFEVSLDLVGLVDLVVCDYNYVFDPAVALQSFQEGPNRDLLLIVDEAHNLLERGRDYYSPALEQGQLDALRTFLAAGKGLVFRELESLLAEIEAQLHTVRREAEPAGGGPFEALVDLDPGPFERLRERLDHLLVSYFLHWQGRGGVTAEDPVRRFAADFSRFAGVAALSGDEFVRICRRRNDGSEQLRIFCLDPGRQLGRRIRGLGGTVAMSATLQPLEFYRQVLGFRKTKTETITLPSPFPHRNRLVLTLPQVTTLYRERPANYDPIARIIEEAVRLQEGNYLVFFPSFAFLAQVHRRLSLPGSRIIAQEPEMDSRARSAVLRSLSRRSSGNLVLAVQGGIFAEGVDYPGSMAQGVIVVGPGLPRISFERELIRRHFDAESGKGFEYAFLYPGMNRAVQAAGRLIRTPDDRGVILLLGRRFSQTRYTDCFPPHWYDEDPRELVCRQWQQAVTAFWAGSDPQPMLPG